MSPRPSVEDARRYRDVVASPLTRDRQDMRPRASGIERARPVHADRVLVRRVERHRYAYEYQVGDTAPFCEICELQEAHPIHDSAERLVLLENQEGRDKVGHQLGIVVSVASSHIFDVKPGDLVIYARWPANEFEQGGETYTFLYEEQAILAVLG